MPHRIITAIALALGFTLPAAGEFIEFEFTGNFEVLVGEPPAPWGGIGVGSAFVARYVFDSDTPDLNTSKSAGLYAMESAEIIVDDIAVTPATNEIKIELFNSYQFFSEDFGIGKEDLFFGNVLFFDPGGHIVNDDLLFDIDLERLDVGFELVSPDFEIAGLVTGFSSQVVPAPASMLVLLPCLVCRKRRRTK